ncbi:MAG TPA: OmpH family outer membrane protein [Terriglobia bacterium]|nr:OmpH family outer membrane protein [Terriglobia bacterium]
MRYKVVVGTILASALSAALLTAGQDPSATTAEKIGVINIQAAIAQTQEGKAASGELQKKYEPKRQELQRRQDEVNALQEQLQKQGATLSDDERLRLNRDLDEKTRILKRMTDDDQSDWQADNQDAVQRIGQKMIKVIGDYAAKNGFTLILDDAQLPVYYVAKGIDITEPMIALYDQTNPAAGAASAPATGAAKPAATKPAAKPKP